RADRASAWGDRGERVAHGAFPILGRLQLAGPRSHRGPFLGTESLRGLGRCPDLRHDTPFVRSTPFRRWAVRVDLLLDYGSPGRRTATSAEDRRSRFLGVLLTYVEPPEPMRGLEVPPQVVEPLGQGKRPPVTITVNG